MAFICAFLLAATPVATGAESAGATGSGRAAKEAIPAKRGTPHKIDWLILPFVTYNSDSKFGYGAAALVQWTGGVEPYRYQLAVQVLYTTGGVQNHWIDFDAPRFLGSKLRIWAAAEYHREKFTPYYGPGNESSDSVADHPGLGGAHPFEYQRTLPLFRLGASLPLLGPLRIFALGTFRLVHNETYAGSLLAAQAPYGLAGGRELQLSGGIYLDTRDNEVVPSRGTLVGISVRGVSQMLGSNYTWAGATIRVLRFISLLPRLVLAMRLEADGITQGAPFFDLPSFGGIDAIGGVGGTWSERGVPQNRYVGRFKALATVELRATLGQFLFRDERINFGAVAFLDLGRAYEPGTPDSLSPLLGIHPGYGTGLRIWIRAFVLRADVASSPDRLFSVYLMFGQFF